MPSTHGHALIIGVGSYQYEPWLTVPITVADAAAVATVVHDPPFCGYPAGQVTLLTNATATRRTSLPSRARLLMPLTTMRWHGSSSPSASTRMSSATSGCAKSSSNRSTRPRIGPSSGNGLSATTSSGTSTAASPYPATCASSGSPTCAMEGNGN